MKKDQDAHDVVSTVQFVTPAMAALWLKESQHHNRSLNIRLVKAYARDMAEGRWVVNGQGLVFGPHGELLDGQHRLHAIVEAGVPIETLVTTNIAVEHFYTLDRNKSRSFSDVLHINGYKSTHRLAAVTQIYMQIVEDNVSNFENRGNNRTMDELQDFFLAHESDLVYGCQKANQLRFLMAGGIAGALLIFARAISPDEAEDFATSLAIGANLTPDDPVLHMRNLLYVRTLGKEAKRRTRTEQYYLGAIAWNIRRKNRSGRTLRRMWSNALAAGKRPILI